MSVRREPLPLTEQETASGKVVGPGTAGPAEEDSVTKSDAGGAAAAAETSGYFNKYIYFIVKLL